MPNGLKLSVVIGAAVGVFLLFHESEVQHDPGQIAPNDPVQTTIHDAPSFQKGAYTITPLAGFDITARILSRERYRFDAGSDLSPVDLALGWGVMSDTAVLDRISISQSGRWYYWRTANYPVPRKAIISHSANMHMIPADQTVSDALLDLKKGEVVHIVGKLVLVTKPDGWRWRSSLTRKDTGNRSCELVWVESVSRPVTVN